MKQRLKFIIFFFYILFSASISCATSFLYAVNQNNTISICPFTPDGTTLGKCTAYNFEHFKPANITTTLSYAYISSKNNTIYICIRDVGTGLISNCRDSGVYINNPGSLRISTSNVLFITSSTDAGGYVSACKISNYGQLTDCTLAGSGFNKPTGISTSNFSLFTYVVQPFNKSIAICPMASILTFGTCSTFTDKDTILKPVSSVTDTYGFYVYIADAVSSKAAVICTSEYMGEQLGTCNGYAIGNESAATDILMDANSYNIYVSAGNAIINCKVDYSDSNTQLKSCKSYKDASFNNILSLAYNK